jgi:GntR family transcriptional regulator, transcriptional repressor for pyruvate dehydrogenase complex
VTTDPDPFGPLERTPLSLQVSRRLREAIVSGRLAEGSQLPTEQQLTARFGVSRSTVREALRVLQAQGLLSGGDTVSTSRPRVSFDRTHASAAEALDNALRLGRVSLPDLVELRLLLEGAAAASADPARLGRARAALATMRRPAVDVDAFHAADVEFHVTLAAASGNAAFALVMGGLREVIAAYLRRAFDTLDDPHETFARLAGQHAAILDAIDAGDGATARHLVQSHVWDFYSAPR